MFRVPSQISTLKRCFNTWAAPLPAELKTFLAILPDLIPSRRLEIRPQHIKDAAVGHEQGWIISAGATFSDNSRLKMTGSWMLIRAESIERARERLSADIYATGGAWDMESATITAVAIAMQKK